LLILILKICEHVDALRFFLGAFGRPISEVFADHMSGLLEAAEKTADYLTYLLLTAPLAAVTDNQEIACAALMTCLDGDGNSKATTEKLIVELANRGAFANVKKEFVEKVIDDMVWSPGKEKVAYREAATYAMAALIRTNAIDDEMLTNDIDKILPVILSSFNDTWADCVRVAGAEVLKQFVIRSVNACNEFDKIYAAIRERLDDHMIQVRVEASGILGIYLPKCTHVETVKSKWNELILFIDDENEQIRNSIAQLCRLVGAVPQWKEDIVKTLLQQQNFHPEANALCQQVVSELQ
jgi:hypothetical protein